VREFRGCIDIYVAIAHADLQGHDFLNRTNHQKSFLVKSAAYDRPLKKHQDPYAKTIQRYPYSPEQVRANDSHMLRCTAVTHCLNCGMHVNARDRRCPKCDNHLDAQTDGSTITVDIAHHGERVRDALQKMNSEVKHARAGVAQYLRLIVGSGVIREEVMMSLRDLEFRKVIIRADFESENSGAILVQLKPGHRH
jgi:hypothetical protein